MYDEADGIVRRDFPASGDGYDRAAVDAHLEAVAARVASARPPAADRDLVSAGRALLAEIASLRGELKRVSDGLRDQSATIARTLDELLDLEADLGEPGPDRPLGPEPLVRLAPPPPAPPVPPLAAPTEAQGAGDDGLPPPPAPPVPPLAAPTEGEAAGEDGLPRPPAVSVDATVLADARLVALDMALGGSSREEIEAELAARFELPDPAGLTDEVLAAIG